MCRCLRLCLSQFFLIICVQRRQAVYVKHKNETRSRNCCCRGKNIGVTYSEYESVASVNQHARCMRRIILSSVGCLAPPRLIKRPENRAVLWVIKYKICGLNFSSTFFVTFYGEFSEILSYMYTYFRVNYPLFLSDFNETRIFSTDFRKIFKYRIFWKSFHCGSRAPWGRTDIQTRGN
jgi:hypothetical protein